MSFEPVPIPLWRSVYAFVVLEIAVLVSGIELGVIYLLVRPIETSLHVTDTAFAVIASSAYALAVALAYYPAGVLADTFKRRNVVVVGIAVWGLSALVSAYSATSTQLLAARFLEGIGFGISFPSVYSILSDSFSVRLRALIISLYFAGTSFGAGLAYAIGGWLVAVTQHLGTISVASVGRFAPWQVCFLAVFVWSFAVLPFLLLVQEPPRLAAAHGQTATGLRTSLSLFGAFMRVHGALWVRLLLGATILTAVTAAAIAWAPTIALRTYGTPTSVGGAVLGTILSFGGVISVTVAGFLGQGLINGARGYWIPLTIGAVAIVAVALSIAYATAPTFGVSMTMLALLVVFVYGAITLNNSAIQDTVPGSVRGQLVGLLGILNGAPAIVAAPAVAFFSEHFFAKSGGLRPAFALVAAIFSAIACALLVPNKKAYIRARDDLIRASTVDQGSVGARIPGSFDGTALNARQAFTGRSGAGTE